MLKKRSLKERIEAATDAGDFSEKELEEAHRLGLLHVFCQGCGYKKDPCRCMPSDGRRW